jgi:formate/nitrite transporter
MCLPALLAGALLAFAPDGSNMASFGLLSQPLTFGLGKALAGAMFAAGLIMVILAGGELFTGNALMTATLLNKKITCGAMLRNWVVVYIGNFVGAVLIAYLMYYSGLFSSGADLLGGMTVKIAAGKCNLAFGKAFVLGVLCNWLVCLAVWMATGADSTIGKIFSIFFPIWVFVTSGFEHSIANMYYIPAGIFAKANTAFVAASGVAGSALANLSWAGFAVNNLLPVTLGNIVGGAVFVAGVYYMVYREK